MEPGSIVPVHTEVGGCCALDWAEHSLPEFIQPCTGCLLLFPSLCTPPQAVLPSNDIWTG